MNFPGQSLRRAFVSALLVAAGAAGAADLTVSGAASLSNAFTEIGKAFEAGHPGTHVVFNFAASDALLQQIARGAPVDVFASADEETMDKAAAQNLLAAGTRQDFVANRLVVVVPSSAAKSPAALADLTGLQRIALGAPAGVPAGRYAREALDEARLWSAVEPKAVFAQSVRQALDYVARAEVDAGFVYATDAATQKDKVRVAFEVATRTPIRYPIAAIAASTQADAARAFVAYVVSPEGQAVLSRHGFLKP